MENRKTNTTMAFTNAQYEMFDFVIQVIHHDMATKTSFVVDALRNEIKNYLGIKDELSVPDERLIEVAMNKHEALIKSLMGEENWNKFKEGDDQ